MEVALCRRDMAAANTVPRSDLHDAASGKPTETDRPDCAAWTAFGIASAFFLFEYAARVGPGLAAQQIATFYGLSSRGFGALAAAFFWVYAPMHIPAASALGALIILFLSERRRHPVIVAVPTADSTSPSPHTAHA